MISVTLYTLIALSFDRVRPVRGLLWPACHRAPPSVADAAGDRDAGATAIRPQAGDAEP
jgi:hypothetical protein